MDDTWLRQKLGLSILILTGPAARLLSWQQHHRCHFVSFVMCIFGTKFQEHCFNISRDIIDSVFYHFGCTVYYVITFQYRSVSTFRTKKDISKRKAPFACILKSLSNNQQLFFHFIGTLISSKGLSFVGHCSMFNQAPAKLFESCN